MKKIISIAAVLLVVLGLARTVEASDKKLLGVITEARPSVLDVLTAYPCSDKWYSQALADSKIKPEDAHKVKLGKEIYLSADNCKRWPSAEIAAESVRLLSRPAPVTVPVPQPVVVAAPPNLQKLERTVARLERELDEMTKQNAEIRSALDEIKTSQKLEFDLIGQRLGHFRDRLFPTPEGQKVENVEGVKRVEAKELTRLEKVNAYFRLHPWQGLLCFLGILCLIWAGMRVRRSRI